MSKGRSKRGMFEGDLKNGELEIGQISASIKEVFSVEEIMNNLLNDFNEQKKHVINLSSWYSKESHRAIEVLKFAKNFIVFH